MTRNNVQAVIARAAKYRKVYRWWRNHARESADPKTCLRYALNQLRLARHMEESPHYYVQKAEHQTDWQAFSAWSNVQRRRPRE